ncbi:MAG: ATP-binding protein [Desulfarculaceae bacterium]|nr:ATP-binding protein [Desulfarculaceae bacterium]MCF8072024.1 ATP-binding protein [Desulfarculaceae bacterium]MCF8101541.1 ATP-binding protein [Desulfarculaceae bacterium]MCF8115091.1 ATP-binding protein [Desulfarculaceae bacterium]
MKLVKTTLENYRRYAEPTIFALNDFTALIGKNDSGKSSLLEALDLFFNEKRLDSDDCCVFTGSDTIRVSCEFSEPPDGPIVIDSSYSTTLKDEYLLNENGNVEIIKEFIGGKSKPKNVYIKCLHPKVEGANDLLSLTLPQLKKRASELGVDLTSVDERAKAEIRRAIWDFFGELNLASTEIIVKSDDVKNINATLESEMPIYSLFKADRPSTDQDEEAQDPLNLAIKEAISSQQAELDRITELVRKQISDVASATVDKLAELDENLAKELLPRVTHKKWETLFGVSLTDEGQVPINKRGSGVRRLILLSFFRAKADSSAGEANKNSVILAIEEPETSQHPDNQAMLLEAFQELAETGNYQVIITTHTPVLVRKLPLNKIIFITGEPGATPSIVGGEDAARLAIDSLGVLLDHDVKLFIGVEGVRDIDFWRNTSKTLIGHGLDIPDLISLEREGNVVFIPLGGSSLECWASRLDGLNIPEIHIYDRDAGPTDPPVTPHARTAAEVNGRERCCAFITCFRETENYLHLDAIQEEYGDGLSIVVNGSSDVPQDVAKAFCALNGGDWNALGDRQRKSREAKAKKRLNDQVVCKMNPERFSVSDPNGFLNTVFSAIKNALDEDWDSLGRAVVPPWC